ncbi:hypothetical protein, partial [Escherichia coli]|uniref:hypothetical protein n=1 Tax=Escherichia coli TaxID=562 RepID=UPI001E33F732
EKRVFLVILFTSFSGSLVSRIPGAVQGGLCYGVSDQHVGDNAVFFFKAPTRNGDCNDNGLLDRDVNTRFVILSVSEP